MDIQMDKFGLSLDQTEILYNLEYYKTLDDIEHTNIPITGESVKELKTAWLHEWAKFISDGFESFTQVPGAKMHWYTILWANCNSILLDKILMNRGIV